MPRVITVSSNKGGVGKTTVAANLAIYLRALREELPVLIVGLDDQTTLDRMFSLGPAPRDLGNLKHVFAERSLSRCIQLGEYGIDFVASPPDTAPLKARAEDANTLRRIVELSERSGIVIFDTKSDLEALTQNALHAADVVIIPVSDWSSLDEAGKILAQLARSGRPGVKVRILLTLVDARTKVDEESHDLRSRLEHEIRRRGWPHYATWLSRSPRVEALNSGTGKPLSILHHAQGTQIHRQLRALAEEVLADLGLAEEEDSLAPLAQPRPFVAARALRPEAGVDWKRALLRGLRGR